MPKFYVLISTSDGYFKTVEAPNAEAARELIEAEDNWGDPSADWQHTLDCNCAIEAIEEIEESQ